MESRSLKAYTTRAGSNYDLYTRIGVGSIVLIFLFFLIHHQFDIPLIYWEYLLIGFSLLYWIGLFIANFFRYEKENAVFDGEIVFSTDKIQIRRQTFLISEISKIDFSDIKDIYGNSKNHHWGHLPKHSNGLDNELVLILNSGENIKCKFQQTHGRKLNLFKELLIHYYKQGIVSWLQLIDVLEIKDYDKIQEFKKEIH